MRLPGPPGGVISSVFAPRCDGLHELGVLPGHGGPIAFLRDVIASMGAERLGNFRPRHQQVEVLEDQILFARAHRHFQTDIVGELRERADLGNQHRFTQPQ